MYRYYGLKPKLDEAYIRIKELERENDFLKWAKVVQVNNSENTVVDHVKKTFNDVLTQTQPVIHAAISEKTTVDQIQKTFNDVLTQTQQILCVDKVCNFKKITCRI